jgi:hypothetical protein
MVSRISMMPGLPTSLPDAHRGPRAAATKTGSRRCVRVFSLQRFTLPCSRQLDARLHAQEQGAEADQDLAGRPHVDPPCVAAANCQVMRLCTPRGAADTPRSTGTRRDTGDRPGRSPSLDAGTLERAGCRSVKAVAGLFYPTRLSPEPRIGRNKAGRSSLRQKAARGRRWP